MADLVNLPRAVWKRQPSGMVAINWANPLTKGLLVLWDYYHQTKWIPYNSNAASTNVSPMGIGLNLGSNCLDYFVDTPAQHYSALCIADFSGISDWKHLLNVDRWLRIARRNENKIVVYSATPTVNNDWLSISTAFSGIKKVIVTYDQSTTITLDIDGGFQSYSVASSALSSSPINHVTLGGAFAISDRAVTNWGQSIYLCAVWNRLLSLWERKSLYENPWQLFAPGPPRLYLIPSSGGVITLVVQDATHSHSVDNLSLTQAHVLALADSLHGHSVESPILSQSYALTLAAAAHAHNANNLDLSQAHSLTMTEASHNHSAEAPLLTQAHILNLSDASHSHSVESPTLTLASSLIVAEANHTHSADAPSLTQAHTITLQDASHSHSVESIVLTQAYVLVAADTAHSHSGEAITLSTELNLAIADALHSHTVEEPRLTQAHVLSLADALHSHTAESVSMGQGYSLIVADASHSHSVNSPTVSVAFVLAVQDALHSQAADALLLATHVTLIVSDALHAHLAGTASEITLPTGDRIFLVAYEDRLFLVSTEDRVFGV